MKKFFGMHYWEYTVRRLWFRSYDPIGTTSDAISQCQFHDFSSEQAIEESLFLHLKNKLKGLDIRRQYPHDRVKADILIEECVAIEIKLNLTTTKSQRLIGQLDTYARWGVKMIVLLVGKADDDLKRRIEERLIKDWDDEDDTRLIHITTPVL